MDDDTQNDNLAHDPAQQPDATPAAGAPTDAPIDPAAEPIAQDAGAQAATDEPETGPEPDPTEPAFPDHIRFEIGHVSELKAWIESWFDWKVDQLRSAPYQYEPPEPPAEQT